MPPPDATSTPDDGGAALAPTYHRDLLRYPYLTDVTGPYATINWATVDTSLNGYVRWGEAGVESCTAHTTPAGATVILVNRVREYQWKANLNLRPNTRYCYRVYLDSINLLGSDSSPSFWTQLPPNSGQAFSFAVFGDWGMVDANGRNPDQANVLAQIARSSARFAVTTGDNGYPAGSQNNYGDLVQVGPNLSGVFGPAFWKV
ncbi:MAG TPA: metallophosphoesterase family protein, partial [Chloroflexia bacterium]|nr:metallophosphoesterase family protein [Chloroflexia bacterium]